MSSAPVVILGCGYVGTRIARAMLADGRKVRVTARSTGKLAPLGELGAEIKYLEAATPKQFTAALSSMHDALVIYSIPPSPALPAGQAIRAALQAAHGVGANAFIYLSSSGLYGAHPDDDAWVDEDTPITRDDAPMKGVLFDEQELEASTYGTPRVVILRLAPVYGPGRGVRERMRKGLFKILDDGQHATSRIHVDDVVRVVRAAEARGAHKSRYLLADDEPTTQGEYARWLSERTGLPMPPSRALIESGAPKVAHRNRRIRNTRMKDELGVTLLYRSFREGEAAIEAEETGAATPPPIETAAPPASGPIELPAEPPRSEGG
jgi:nucleoside-diphosphate-sugar epimerase